MPEWRRVISSYFLVCTILMVLTSGASAAPGSLDPAFGTNGIYDDAQTAFSLFPSDLAQQPDGKILVVGTSRDGGTSYTTKRVLLRRYNRDGTVDLSFGHGGFPLASTNPFDLDVWGEGASVTVQPDYKIVVVGLTYASNNISDTRITLWRFNPSGVLDTSFGVDGVFVLNPSVVGYATSVTMSQGKILFLSWEGGHAALRRLNLDGTFDIMFGFFGPVIVSGTTASPSARALTVNTTTGDIYVGGGGYSTIDGKPRLEIAKYTANGAIASGFGANGVAMTPMTFGYGVCGQASGGNSRYYGLMAYPDGRIAGAGLAEDLGNQFWTTNVLGRFDINGISDTAFNLSGSVGDPCLANTFFQLDSSALQNDGKIAYLKHVNNLLSPTLFRVNVDGTPDTSFIPANIDFGPTQYLMLQSGISKIVRLGTYKFGRAAVQRIKLARYLL